MMSVPRETHEKLERFAVLLEEWNSRINLISPRDMPQLWSRHIDDSLQLASHIPTGARITDLGSGGGFPGLILAIATDSAVTMIESDQRKCAFLREASRVCGVKTTVISKRIEQVDVQSAAADVVTARALASLRTLLGWAEPFLNKEGFCLFLKGRKTSDELTEAACDWHMTYDTFPSRTHEDGALLKISDIKRV